MDIETRVAGIPCVVRVTYFAPADMGCTGGEADFWRSAVAHLISSTTSSTAAAAPRRGSKKAQQPRA